MEEVLMSIAVAIVGGALFRWLRHKTWRITLFAIAFIVLTRKLLQVTPRDPEAVWIGASFFLLLSLAGAFLIGLILRSRVVRAARGGAILLSKNVDALAEVARQHDSATPRK